MAGSGERERQLARADLQQLQGLSDVGKGQAACGFNVVCAAGRGAVELPSPEGGMPDDVFLAVFDFLVDAFFAAGIAFFEALLAAADFFAATPVFFAAAFFAGTFFAATFPPATFFEATFFAVTFFVAAFLAGAFFAAIFLLAAFFAGAFFAALIIFFAATFFIGIFLEAAFLAGAAFFAPTFLAAVFFAAAFFAVAIVFHSLIQFCNEHFTAAFLLQKRGRQAIQATGPRPVHMNSDTHPGSQTSDDRPDTPGTHTYFKRASRFVVKHLPGSGVLLNPRTMPRPTGTRSRAFRRNFVPSSSRSFRSSRETGFPRAGTVRQARSASRAGSRCSAGNS